MVLFRKVLVVSDNLFLISHFHSLVSPFTETEVTYCCSPGKTSLLDNPLLPVKVFAIDMKKDQTGLPSKYDLIFSLHCKQLFPAELIKKIKCINVHPGFNPYNRGWFPQVFSIVNGMKAGATIHEIDEQLDHGAIIAQREVPIESYDTSMSVYEKIQTAEVELLKENLENILSNNYSTFLPKEEGKVNLKKDFNALCKIDLNKRVTMKWALDYLRALTHGDYKNAYFIDEHTGSKVFVTLRLEKE